MATKARKREFVGDDQVFPPPKAGRTASQPRTRTHNSPKDTSETVANAKKVKVDEKNDHVRHVLLTNRAPVLTLWVATVSQRQGYTLEEGLTFGRWVAGVLAQSKGRSLGIYTPKEKTDEMVKAQQRKEVEMGVHRVEAFGMHIPVVGSPGGQLRAVSGEKYSPLNPRQSESYLSKSLGEEGYRDCRQAMKVLAEAVPQEEIGKKAYSLYERFRPEWKGWGGKGHLDLDLIYSMAKSLNE